MVLLNHEHQVPIYSDGTYTVYKNISSASNGSSNAENVFSNSHSFDSYNTSSSLKDDITYRALPDLDDMLSHPMPTRILRSATPPPNLESLTSGLSSNAFSSISNLTSNRYPYNSTMSELFDDLATQRNMTSEYSRVRESRSLPPEDHPRVVSTTLPTYPSMYTVPRKAYRQPQTYYEQKVKSAPTYQYQKRRTLEDLVDPDLLKNSGGSFQVPIGGITGRRPRSAYEFTSPVVPFHKSDKYRYGGYTTSYQPYVPYRNVYQPPSYWEAYNRPYKQYRYITDPRPYHTVRELEMDRINRDKQLEGFKKKIREVPTTDYTSSLMTAPSSTSKLDGTDYGRRKENRETIVDRPSYSTRPYERKHQPIQYDIVDAASEDEDKSSSAYSKSKVDIPDTAKESLNEDSNAENCMAKSNIKNGFEPVMDKLLSSNSKTDEGNENEEEDVANDSSKDANEQVENEECNDADDEKKALDEGNTVKNDGTDVEKIDTENEPASSTDDTLDAVTDEAVKDDEKTDDVNQGKNDEEKLIDEESVGNETGANEMDAEAGGMLRAAIDGLPVDLECVKDETEINATEEQVESDSKTEECEEKDITESARTSNKDSADSILETTNSITTKSVTNDVTTDVTTDSVDKATKNKTTTRVKTRTKTRKTKITTTITQENEDPNQETEAEPEVTIEKVVEEETVVEDGSDITKDESIDGGCDMANGEVDDKPSEATNMSSFVIEEVTISVKNVDSSEAEGENALGTYTLVDGNTGQKLVDEKDIGNDESIRTEYEIEDVIIDAEE